MKFTANLLVIEAQDRLSEHVRSRRFPPFRLRRRRESSTLCTQGPARGPFFATGIRRWWSLGRRTAA